MNQQANSSIVIVEDNVADRIHYLRMLEAEGSPYKSINLFEKINEACEHILEHPPTCCIFDYYLPDGHAEDLIEMLRNKDGHLVCPIIVMTSREDTKIAVNLMQLGVQDYLIKQDLKDHIFLKSISAAVKTWRLQNEIHHLALYDSLTGLINRALFIDRLEHLFLDSQRYEKKFAVIYIDLDRFKQVNDTFGHQAGDYLLQCVAKRLLKTLRKSDTAARLGGDEFAVLLPDIEETKANLVAYKLVNKLSFELNWQASKIAISPSVGLATFPSKAETYQDLMSEADFALYKAKENGRGQYSAFNRKMEVETRELLQLATDLPLALLNNDLKIAFQPIINMKTGSIALVEALVRWFHKGKWVRPEIIIDLVIENKLGSLFHEWLFNQTLYQIKKWRETEPQLKVSINLPANLCHETKLVNQLISSAHSHHVASENIIVEVTETHLMRYPEETKKQLMTLANNDFKLALDDFGTGYSSMKYLANLPFSILKIDETFFSDLENNNKNETIIEAVSALSHGLGLTVIAEGIESKKLLETAETLGCDYAQGYYLGAPAIGNGSFQQYYYDSMTQANTLMKKRA